MASTEQTPLQNVRPRISIDGAERANLGEATLALQIHLPRLGMSHAELRLLNWGPSASGQPDFLFQQLALGSRIEIHLGETGDAAAFTGEITALEERYGDGAPQLVVLAEDALHRLARQRRNRAFEDMSLDAVVQQLAGEANLQSDVNISSASGVWLQANESSLAFLLRLLSPHDVCLRMHDGGLRARDDEADPQPVQLNPATAQQIRLVADLNQLPRTLTVQGYDLDADQAVNHQQDSLSPAPQGQSGAALLEQLGWAGDSILPHPFARTQQEAQALAQRQFRQRAQRFVHGEIVCMGNPRLRSGSEVELRQVSPRLAGRYRVMECWHQFDSALGLRTRVRVQRPDWSV